MNKDITNENRDRSGLPVQMNVAEAAGQCSEAEDNAKPDYNEGIAHENRVRCAVHYDAYNQITGEGCCGHRRLVDARRWGDGMAYVPEAMLADGEYRLVGTVEAWARLRCRYDFEYWAARCATIQDKTTGQLHRFTLNRPQRRVLALLEEDRLANRPIRLIMLKARQWGGSTLVQMYMAWIQTCVKTNCNSLICSHVKDTSALIRGMYSRMLAEYPEELWQGEERGRFKPFEGSSNIRVIEGRGCKVAVASMQCYDSVRGGDVAMAHLSEVAFWRETPQSTPEMFIRAICGAINYVPGTMVVMESTANGVGNYFHREWLRSVEGRSDKRAVFVPWYEIEIYRVDNIDYRKVWQKMDDYEYWLWRKGLTLEQIAWYQYKRREYPDRKQMQSEYPTTDAEAFATISDNVFASNDVEHLRRHCCEPILRGEIETKAVAQGSGQTKVAVKRHDDGNLEIWRMPTADAGRYLVTVDIGGRSASSDWSVIAVLDRRGGPNRATPEFVAQWRGHIDHDLLAWKAVALARFYNNALLVFESNTLESEDTDGDPSLYILNQVGRIYPNLYRRKLAGGGHRLGFHTNRATKSQAITTLIAAVRDDMIIEHSEGALNEMLTYKMGRNGQYHAADGCHDDMLMTRAIGLLVAMSTPTAPTVTSEESLAEYLEQYRKKKFQE